MPRVGRTQILESNSRLNNFNNNYPNQNINRRQPRSVEKTMKSSRIY